MEPSPTRLLVVDDDPLIRFSITERMKSEGHEVRSADAGGPAIQEFERGVDVAVLDYRLPDCTGIDLLRHMRASDPAVPVIMLTGFSEVDQAVLAMKEGAFHYGQKPVDLDRLASLVNVALENSRLRRHLRALERASGEGPSLIGESPSMRRVRSLVERIAVSPSSTVLVTGESGTGKDVVAHLLHARSGRSEGPFINVTCSALPDTLLESELFGHEKGAFTDARARKVGLVELAQGGTLFLDEIGEMSPNLQAKLLRVLEEKVYRRVGGAVDLRADVRIVAATNRALAEEIASGQFREDLYYRLAVLELALPPLRERAEDIRLLTEYFVRQFARQFRHPVGDITDAAWDVLESYRWPGNVRELRNVLERAVLLAEGATLDADDFPACRPGPTSTRTRFELPPGGVDLGEVERDLLVQALEVSKGNRTHAGRLLGLNRDQVRYRITKLGLEDDDDDDDDEPDDAPAPPS